MALKADLRSHNRELEALLKRVAILEDMRGVTSSGSATPTAIADMSVRLDQLETSITDVEVSGDGLDLANRVEKMETSLSDVSTMGPKKLAMKFGARMDAFDERLQAIEAGVKP